MDWRMGISAVLWIGLTQASYSKNYGGWKKQLGNILQIGVSPESPSPFRWGQV